MTDSIFFWTRLYDLFADGTAFLRFLGTCCSTTSPVVASTDETTFVAARLSVVPSGVELLSQCRMRNTLQMKIENEHEHEIILVIEM